MYYVQYIMYYEQCCINFLKSMKLNELCEVMAYTSNYLHLESSSTCNTHRFERICYSSLLKMGNTNNT